jgi:hypothetical protein
VEPRLLEARVAAELPPLLNALLLWVERCCEGVCIVVGRDGVDGVVEGRVPTVPVEGRVPAVLVEGRVPTVPVEGRVPTVPVDGRVPAVPPEP